MREETSEITNLMKKTKINVCGFQVIIGGSEVKISSRGSIRPLRLKFAFG